MAGGIAILVLITVLLVAGGIALALYAAGDVLGLRRTDPHSRKDRAAPR